MIAPSLGHVLCREIADGDLDGVVACLRRNFPLRSAAFWRGALARFAALPAAEGRPRYGFCLDAGGEIVGVILLLSHASPLAGAPPPRAALSSWAVDSAYRGFALVLQRRATRERETSYLDLTAAPHTLRTIEAFGFRCYARGTLLARPLAGPGAPGAQLVAFSPDAAAAAGLSPWERAMLADHAALGLSCWLGVRDGRTTPLVVKLRPLWRHWVPAARLIYASSEADLAAFAPALGRALLRRGRLDLIVAANGPIDGLPGRYLDGRQPLYFLKSPPPASTDLAYGELALI